MKLLLDTNVWRYLVDTESQDYLFKIAHKSKIKITLCPIVVIETLRMSDLNLRKRIIEVQTRECWERLMPDAFLQYQDVKAEILRTHPEWELDKKNLHLFRNLRYDWIRSHGGFWSAVKNQTDRVAQQYLSKDAVMLNTVREQSREMRSQVLNNKDKTVEPLSTLTGSWQLNNGTTIEVEFWRVYSQTVWLNSLIEQKSSLREWMICDFDIELMISYYGLELLNFWAYEVNTNSVPREWLRAAFYILQSQRKVTDGNPVDCAIATHLVDVDIMVSADKNFISMAKQCKDEAPFSLATAYLIESGKKGIDQLFQKISDRFN